MIMTGNMREREPKSKTARRLMREWALKWRESKDVADLELAVACRRAELNWRRHESLG